MLSRPSEKRIVAGALPAAKACVPRRNRMLSRHGEHAFAASLSMQWDWFLVGRESMAPTSTSLPMAEDLVTDRVPILFVVLSAYRSEGSFFQERG